MGENTNIEWCNHTLNLWWGCTEVHEGCDNCYARVWDNRYNGNHWGAHRPRRIIPNAFKELLKYQKKAAEAGELHTVFCGSMMDIFERSMPLVDHKGNPLEGIKTGDLRDKLFNEYVPQCPNLIFLFLTKRPHSINRYIPASWKENPPKNVWFGYSAVNQATANKGIPHLLGVKGNLFLSCEPMLGEIDLTNIVIRGNNDNEVNALTGAYLHSSYETNRIRWVICGGESGHKARPMHPKWARDLQEQCSEGFYTVPFFFKQWGEFAPNCLCEGDKACNSVPRPDAPPQGVMFRCGKKKSGRVLYDREYSEFPAWEAGSVQEPTTAGER